MTFWESLKEAFLELIFGYWQLKAWREEDAARRECEHTLQRHYEAYKRENP
jgi:hypothetical protein